ncbi:hypothetical protein [Thiomicrorhabdus sp. Kp2]|uniref:hypothetical protein n=1 Tax=Thiomicrorhabdus sp. Kp2 TaxID=1123518 RepID=UPI0004203AB0|nr:hypothetical protein [Thiomicrorhabdus sp. Kp2]
MSNSIVENPTLNQLFGSKEQTKKHQPGLGVSELFKANKQADEMAKQAAQSNKTRSNDVTYQPSQKATLAALQMTSVERAYQYSETMSLQLTTKEGDKVTVDFRQLYAQYQSYQEMQTSEKGPQGVRYFESRDAMEMTQFEEQFAFSVEGDLNEDELKAVFDVFEQVDSLSQQFFDGNIEKALQQAMALNIDFGQLDSFKLDLTQTESLATTYQQAALAEYNNVQNQTSQPGEKNVEEYGVDMSNLPPYLQNWQQAIERLNTQFENAQSFLNELMGEVNAQRFPEQDSHQGWLDRVKEFHQQLVEMAQVNTKETVGLDATEKMSEPLTEAIAPDVKKTEVNE